VLQRAVTLLAVASWFSALADHYMCSSLTDERGAHVDYWLLQWPAQDVGSVQHSGLHDSSIWRFALIRYCSVMLLIADERQPGVDRGFVRQLAGSALQSGLDTGLRHEF
jgi:hypothetical protein